MDELKASCKEGGPIILSPEWNQYETAKQHLRENGYTELVESSFIKNQSEVTNQASSYAGLVCTFPDALQVEYAAPTSGNRGRTLDLEGWKQVKSVQLDTKDNQQLIITASIPRETRKQQVRIKLSIQPYVKMEGNLSIRLDTDVLCIVIPKQEMFTEKTKLGCYPSLVALYLEPQLDTPNKVALPHYYYLNPDGVTKAEDKVKRTKGTKLGGNIGWKGYLGVTAERTWGEEMEDSRTIQKLDIVELEDNAGGFEWMIVKWGPNGPKYNKEKPHYGCPRELKLPFGTARNTSLRLEDFPTVVWKLDPEISNYQSSINFKLLMKIELDLVWFDGITPWFKQPCSTSYTAEFRQVFEVKLN